MTHDQIAALILGLCVLVPCLLAIACWILWAERKRARDLQAIVDAHRHWCGGE